MEPRAQGAPGLAELRAEPQHELPRAQGAPVEVLLQSERQHDLPRANPRDRRSSSVPTELVRRRRQATAAAGCCCCTLVCVQHPSAQAHTWAERPLRTPLPAPLQRRQRTFPREVPVQPVPLPISGRTLGRHVSLGPGWEANREGAEQYASPPDQPSTSHAPPLPEVGLGWLGWPAAETADAAALC